MRQETTPILKSRHVEMLVISTLAIIGSFVLEVGPSGCVHLSGMPFCQVPQTCFSQDIFGVSCPGCGLTRSFIHLADFNLQASLQIHRLGWLFFIVTLAQIPYRTFALRHEGSLLMSNAGGKMFGNLLIAMLIINWLIGMLFYKTIGGN